MSEAMHSVMDAELIEGTLTFGAREAERRVTGMLKGLKPEGCVLTSAEAITDGGNEVRDAMAANDERAANADLSDLVESWGEGDDA